VVGDQQHSQQSIERSLSDAGWLLDGSFTDHLVIGYTEDGLSILAAKEAWETDDNPVFELIDHNSDLTYGVDEVPTPQQAEKLLQEHGLPSGERED
jgi:hypothetical protein